jgi:hypothetical protein
MDKLAKFAAQSNNMEEGSVNMNKQLDIFRLFKKYTDKIIDE